MRSGQARISRLVPPIKAARADFRRVDLRRVRVKRVTDFRRANFGSARAPIIGAAESVAPPRILGAPISRALDFTYTRIFESRACSRVVRYINEYKKKRSP